MSCDTRECTSHFMGFEKKDYIATDQECLAKCPICTNRKCYPILKEPLFCPPDYKYCSWGPNDSGCIPDKTTCQSSRSDYKNLYSLSNVKPCQLYNEENRWLLKPLSECSAKPLLTRKISYSKREEVDLIPRFIIDAHGSIDEGTTCIPPYMNLKTWGSWGKFQWSSINTKLINILENRQVTRKELQKIYKDESIYSCDPKIFPLDSGKNYYELGNPPFIPYNNHCYKIILSSKGSYNTGKAEMSVIKDITKTNDYPLKRGGVIYTNNKWKKIPLSNVLKWIHKYSKDTYGECGKPSIYKGDNRTVARIRVNLFCCLNYKKKGCLSDFWDPSIPQMTLETLMKKRKSIDLYKPGTRWDMKNMEHWRVDPSTTSEYNQYFQRLKEFINEEKNVERLEDIYKFLSGKLYHSLLLNEILEEKYKEDRGYGKRKDIISKLKKYIAEFKLILTAIEYEAIVPIDLMWRQRPNTHEHLLRLLIFEKLRKGSEKGVQELVDLEKNYLNTWINFANKRVDDDEKSDVFKGMWSEQENENWLKTFTRELEKGMFSVLPIQENVEQNDLFDLFELSEVPDLSHLLILYTDTIQKLELIILRDFPPERN